MISASISSHKIDKSLIIEKNGKRFLNFVIFENDKPDEYENDGIIKQSLSKEQREAGAKAPIVGNWKWMDKSRRKSQPASKPASAPSSTDDSDSGSPF